MDIPQLQEHLEAFERRSAPPKRLAALRRSAADLERIKAMVVAFIKKAYEL